MNKRTKFYIGVTLVVSAITALVTFIALCFKKKSALAALAALATAEGLIGLALIEDNNIIKRRKTAVDIDAELDAENGDESDEIARIDFEVPTDDEATEEDFI